MAVAPYVLRYWESEFPQLAPHKGSGGQRRYQRADVELALTIRDMLYRDGFTIAGARRRLEEKKHPLSAAAGAALPPAAPPAAPAVASVPPVVKNFPAPAPQAAANAANVAGPPPAGVRKVRQGLQDLLRLLDNTDARRADVRSERSGGRGE